MPGIAAAISWNGDPLVPELVHRMLDALPQRGGQRHVLQPQIGVALGTVDATEPPPPFCVADLRLDNRAELNRVLGHDASVSAAQMLRHGHDRWGTALADRLRGDFAFAIWDANRRRLHAARDPFGVRPLFYHATSVRLLLASTVESLVAAGASEGHLDEGTVREFLAGDHRRFRETFFAGIFRVLPGHWLLATPQGSREERYWHPPARDIRGRPDDYPRAFRALFRAAVADRLQGPALIAAQLSGGLDSSSIVCMADEIARNAKGPAPRLHTVSAVYPGLECNETAFIHTVSRQVRFPGHSWDGTEPNPLAPLEPCIAHPWAGTSLAGMDGDLRLARQIGAGVLLGGFGGDELLFERGVFRDLAARGQWLTLLLQTVFAPGVYSSRTGAEFLEDAIRGALPASLRRAYRKFRPRPPAVPPPGLAAPPPWEETAVPPRGPFRDFTRQCLWNWLTRPNLWWSVELQVLRAARQGIEMRFPFLDRRLADFLLAIPAEHRLPRGRMKRLLRQAMTGCLPTAILQRKSVTAFDCLAAVAFRQHRATLRGLFGEDKWFAKPYVDQKNVRRLFETLDKDPAYWLNTSNCATLLQIAQFEVWLRVLHDRHVLRANSKGPTMNHSDPIPLSPSPNLPDAPSASAPAELSTAYEPPCLTPAGNLRDLLGKSGARSDWGPSTRRS